MENSKTVEKRTEALVEYSIRFKLMGKCIAEQGLQLLTNLKQAVNNDTCLPAPK
ncbi:MAG: hypothetical protein ACO1NW_03400 [Chitinophagaceae bacterium]